MESTNQQQCLLASSSTTTLVVHCCNKLFHQLGVTSTNKKCPVLTGLQSCTNCPQSCTLWSIAGFCLHFKIAKIISDLGFNYLIIEREPLPLYINEFRECVSCHTCDIRPNVPFLSLSPSIDHGDCENSSLHQSHFGR